MIYNQISVSQIGAMQTNQRDLADRLIDFSADVIRLIEALPETMPGRKISDRLIRSVMSVAANYEEARGADSRA